MEKREDELFQEVDDDVETVTVLIPKPKELRKIYWKAYDFFVREFGWPEELLQHSSEKLDFELDFSQNFEENSKRLKKRYHLTSHEVSNLNLNFGLGYTILQQEKSEFNKNLLAKTYGYIFSKEDARFFSKHSSYLADVAEKYYEIDFDHNNWAKQTVLLNLLLCIAFEYACKGLLLFNYYKINEPEACDKPIKSLKVTVTPNPTRTISLDVAWQFIRDKKLLSLNRKEKNTGNRLAYLRNMVTHTPLSMHSRGSYPRDSINLIRKINGD